MIELKNKNHKKKMVQKPKEIKNLIIKDEIKK
jgi:hypothetical protein